MSKLLNFEYINQKIFNPEDGKEWEVVYSTRKLPTRSQFINQLNTKLCKKKL